MRTVFERRRHSISAFTLRELIIVMAVLLVLAALVAPSLSRVKAKQARIQCVDNLKQIGLASRIFSNEGGQGFFSSNLTANLNEAELTSKHPGYYWRQFQTLKNELATPNVLICPADKMKRPAASWQMLNGANVSYFFNLTGGEHRPHSVLMGDRNLAVNGAAAKAGVVELSPAARVGWTDEVHESQGNVVLGDASVQQTDDERLNLLMNQTVSANQSKAWLLVP